MVRDNAVANGTIETPAVDGASTNGVNGHVSDEESKADTFFNKNIPVTKIFSEFIHNAKPKDLTPELIDKVKEVVIDFIGVTAGAAKGSESTEAITKAIVGLGGSQGDSTVLAKGKKFTPQYAALLNACYGHSFDFDDTYAEGTLHAGVTTIAVALTQAELLGSSCTPELFMLSICVGYEITCRLGRALGYDTYSRGFHNTSICGIFGSVAVIAVLKGLSPHAIEMALGLAGSKAAGSMQYLDNGSWNKRLHPGFAAHDAFICVALAEAGVIGATHAIEGEFGFLHAYSPKSPKDVKSLVHGLGSGEWIWLASSLKPYPACRMTHGFIEMAGNMRSLKPDVEVEHITLTLSPPNYPIVASTIPNKLHPQNGVDAQFSAYYQTGAAWLYGSALDWSVYDHLQDEKLQSFLDRITCVTDDGYSRFECGLKVRWVDGTEKEDRMPEPLGELSHPFTRDKVDEKFLSLAGPVYGKEKAKEILRSVDVIETLGVGKVLDLVA